MDAVEHAPAWLLRPLPLNAADDPKLSEQIDELGAKLPDYNALRELRNALLGVRTFREYDSAANRASAHVWRAFEGLVADERTRSQLLCFAEEHMTPTALARVCRRLSRDSSSSLRRWVRKLIDSGGFREVSLPQKRDGDWDARGWLAGTVGSELSRHKTGRRAQERSGVPELTNLKALRELLQIRSEKQLGWFLLASDAENGPYTRFTIPKRGGGGEREICAPKPQLRWVQRRILDLILAKVLTHDAAHGFVPGRSTVTNAALHTGAKVIVKFDLTDFFPTIHYYRVVGLFARLGYGVGNTRFAARDDSKQVAPTLARLCCYTPEPSSGRAALPQGAPTSPAISNLVCRRLDARLRGLATRNGAVYSRYADDLTFSFKEPDAVPLGRFRWWVDQVCHQEGFFVNEGKFRVIRSSQRQVVTGIVVNEELHVPREARRRFRAVLHNCRKHGVASQARGHERFGDYLRGFASYVHMVDPDEGAELLRQVEELLGAEGDE
jgi:RNA-directed DNA polymerase